MTKSSVFAHAGVRNVDFSARADEPSPTTTPYLDRLRQHPVIREVPWRQGQELFEDDINSGNRTQQKGALALVARGKIQAEPCETCVKGNGRFTECVAMDEFYSGSCATCVFPSKGVSCSLRNRNAAEESTTPATTKKRKHRATAKALENAANSSNSATRSSRTKATDVEPLDQPARRGDEEEDLNPIEFLNVAAKRHKNDRSAPSPILTLGQSPILPPSRLPAPYGGNTNPPYNKPAVSTTRPQHESWNNRRSFQNGGEPSPSALTSAQTPSQNGNGIGNHPSGFTPVQHSTSHSKSASFPASGEPGARYESMSSDRPSVPVIDTLPKAKQRQIYSVISGMQGGIDHLEKQLNSLKTMLGILDDDEVVGGEVR